MATNIYQFRDMIRSDIKNFGLFNTLYDILYKAANRFLVFRVLRSMVISIVDPNFMKGSEKYSYAFLDSATLYQLAKNQEYDLSDEFLQQALKNGDRCFGIMDGTTLASYGWYSNVPINISFDAAEDGNEELRLHFSNKYIYMYKGYTHRNYRGQRLHAIGMTCALDDYLRKGFEGIVSYVESNNYSSLKSVYRMGYKDFGTVYIFKIFGKYLVHSSRGCKKYGFWLEKL